MVGPLNVHTCGVDDAGDDVDVDVDDYDVYVDIYIMVKCLCVCVCVTKVIIYVFKRFVQVMKGFCPFPKS